MYTQGALVWLCTGVRQLSAYDQAMRQKHFGLCGLLMEAGYRWDENTMQEGYAPRPWCVNCPGGELQRRDVWSLHVLGWNTVVGALTIGWCGIVWRGPASR